MQARPLPDYIEENFPAEAQQYFQAPIQTELPFVRHSFLSNIFRKLAGFLLLPYTLIRTRLINNDEVGLMLDGEGKPQLLGPGWHTLFNPLAEFVERKKLNDYYIRVSSLMILNVPRGQVCLIWDASTGQQKLLTEGRHVLNSSNLKCEGFINLNMPNFIYDPETKKNSPICNNGLRIVRIESTEKGLVNRSGTLELLEPGMHVIMPPDQYIESISTTLQIMELGEIKVNSKDFVNLSIKADAFYKIKDPLTAVMRLGSKKISSFIKEKAKALLNLIIRNQSYMHAGQAHAGSNQQPLDEEKTPELSQVAILTSIDPKEKLNDAEETPVLNLTNFTPEMTASSIHDQFMYQIKAEMQEYGVEFDDIRIESMDIVDPELASQFANQAARSVETQARVFTLKAQALIEQQSALNKARTKLIEAEGEAGGIKTIAEAQKEAEILKAEAQKEAEILKGAGLIGFSDLIEGSPVAQEIALTRAHVGLFSTAGGVTVTELPYGLQRFFQRSVPSLSVINKKSRDDFDLYLSTTPKKC